MQRPELALGWENKPGADSTTPSPQARYSYRSLKGQRRRHAIVSLAGGFPLPTQLGNRNLHHHEAPGLADAACAGSRVCHLQGLRRANTPRAQAPPAWKRRGLGAARGLGAWERGVEPGRGCLGLSETGVWPADVTSAQHCRNFFGLLPVFPTGLRPFRSSFCYSSLFIISYEATTVVITIPEKFYLRLVVKAVCSNMLPNFF